MKTFQIEIQRVKAMTSGHGLVEALIDALVIPQKPSPDGREPSTRLSMSEADARVLFLLLKQQLAEFDKKKARSQR